MTRIGVFFGSFIVVILLIPMLGLLFPVEAQLTPPPSVYYEISSGTVYAELNEDNSMTGEFDVRACVYNSTVWKMTTVIPYSSSDFNVSFDPSQVNILYNNCDNIHVTVTAPSDTHAGTRQFELYGDWTTNMGESGSIEDDVPIEFPQYHRIGVDINPKNVTVRKKETYNFNIQVTNLGNGDDAPMVLIGGNYLTLVKLKWSFTFKPRVLDILGPGKSQSVVLTLNVGTLPDPGEYPISFYGVSGMTSLDLDATEDVKLMLIVPEKGATDGKNDKKDEKDDGFFNAIPGFGSGPAVLSMVLVTVLVSLLRTRPKGQ